MNTLSRTFRQTFPERRTGLPLLPLLVMSLLLMVTVALTRGAYNIPVERLLTGTLDSQQEAVLWSIRLPRVLLAGLVGSALAVSGAALQGLFRNPLADPGLIGIASGAALAAALMIVLAGTVGGLVGMYSLSLAAFMGGLISCLLIFRFARLHGHFSVTCMLLAGIAINALAGAATGFLTYLSDDQQLRALTFWTMGSVGAAVWPAVLVCATVALPMMALLMQAGRALNVLMLGEEEAAHLGVSVSALKRRIVVCTALCVGAAVAVSGIIGFVGLVVPHLVRLALGPDHRTLLPASALLGATLLIAADTLARTLLAPAELPVGIVTSLIGGPVFLWLLLRQRGGIVGL